MENYVPLKNLCLRGNDEKKVIFLKVFEKKGLPADSGSDGASLWGEDVKLPISRGVQQWGPGLYSNGPDSSALGGSRILHGSSAGW